MKWTAPHSYVTPLPFTEWHLGAQATVPNYIITADIFPNFFIGSEGGNVSKRRGPGRIMVAVQPRFNVRLMRGNEYSQRYGHKLDWSYSFPVRTPSYLPGVTVYYALKNKKFQNFITQFSEAQQRSMVALSLTGTSVREKMSTTYHFLKFVGFHHSNGQDGSHDKAVTRRIFETLSDRPESYRKYTGGYPSYLNDRYFNIYNGNFSNDLVVQGFYSWGKYTLGAEGFSQTESLEAKVPRSEKQRFTKGAGTNDTGARVRHYHNRDRLVNQEVGLQVVPVLGEDQLRERYGLLKTLYRYQCIWAGYYNKSFKGNLRDRIPDSRYELGRLIVESSLALNSLRKANRWDEMNLAGKALTRLNVEAKYHFGRSWLNSSTTSLFASVGWKGQDDYNIMLEDSFVFAKLGLTLGSRIYEDKRDKATDLLFESQTPTPQTASQP